MSKFNRGNPGQFGSVTGRFSTSPVRTESVPSGRTHEGAPGFVRDARSELYILGINNLVSEDTFYESGEDRDARFRQLVRWVAISDPIWLHEFLVWLRLGGNMRSAPIVGACEFAKVMLESGTLMRPLVAQEVQTWQEIHGKGILRATVDEVCQRADEPGELLAYWTGRYGKSIPKPIKRGVADAVARLYTEYNLLKYDGTSSDRGYRFGDVIELVHPSPHPAKPWQGDLFKYAIDRRHNRGGLVPNGLRVLTSNTRLRSTVQGLLRYEGGGRVELTRLVADSARLSEAGMTWENVLSLVGDKVEKRALWEAIIPNMGLMALVRNLRNFDQAGISDEMVDFVIGRMTDEHVVRGSRMFPLRFYTAHKQLNSQNWGRGLERALKHSMQNIPELPGRTLILTDTSGSMQSTMSGKSKLEMLEVAALFAIAATIRNVGSVDLFGWADHQFRHQIDTGAAVLSEMAKFERKVGSVGMGTNLHGAMRNTYDDHDRVIIFTDMQAFSAPASRYSWGLDGHAISRAVPSHVPVYVFNLAGHKYSAMATGGSDYGQNRHEIGGGFTDAGFRLIPLLEQSVDGAWPWKLDQVKRGVR